MTKVIAFCILFVITLNFFAQQTSITIIEDGDTTSHQIIYHLTDSFKESKLIGFFKTNPSQKSIEKNYFLGKQGGKEYTYFPSGKIYEVSIFQNGKRNGDYSRYNSLGELVIKARYLNGKLNGFFINRAEHYQGKYSNGLKDGKWEYNVGSPNYYKEFYSNGVLVEKRQIFPTDLPFFNREKTEIIAESKSPNEDSLLIPYQGDSTWFGLQYAPQELLSHPAMRKAYFKDFPNQIAHTKYVYNGYVNGMYKIYYPNGKLYLFANYTAGLLDGSWKMFRENGELLIKGKYLDGKKIGAWKIDIGTKTERKEVYRNGILKKSTSKSK